MKIKAILDDSGQTQNEIYEIKVDEELGRAFCYVPYPNKEDAAFIVRAVNSHNELVECLKGWMNGQANYDPLGWIKKSEKAISKAEGK